MAKVAGRYSSFVVPLPRKGTASVGTALEEKPACEFYFLQWGFHGIPPAPSARDADPFMISASTLPEVTNATENYLPTSTILFTPLQEYKLRSTFATPYLVLTHYTDLVTTHGIVLMRGEITPPSAATASGTMEDGGSGARYLLNQGDAQLLAMKVQKFYLWGSGNDKVKNEETAVGKAEERLLKDFHERPETFNWEELMRVAGADCVAVSR